MKKLLLVLLFIISAVVPVKAAANSEYIYILPEDFSADLGTWQITKYNECLNQTVIMGGVNGKPQTTKNATAKFKATQNGEYYVWAHTRDFAANQPGVRKFKISVNSTSINYEFGTHKQEGFRWENGGSVVLSAGECDITLVDLSAINPRTDVILITNDKNFIPADNLTQLKKDVTAYRGASTPAASAAPVSQTATTPAPTGTPVTTGPPAPVGNSTGAESSTMKKEKNYTFLLPDDFLANPGTWTVAKYNNAYGSEVLCGKGDGIPANTEPAAIAVNIADPGDYTLWVRTRDFAANHPGTRLFKLAVNDKTLPQNFGGHGAEGFQWENGGVVSLKSGINKIVLDDSTAAYPRFDVILLTNDSEYTPSNDLSVLTKAVKSQAQPVISAAQAASLQDDAPSVSIKDPASPDWLFSNGMSRKEITVVLNGKTLDFDQPPVMINGRTMVPMRAIFEQLGAEVEWDESSSTVTGRKGTANVLLKIDSSDAMINGVSKTLDQPAVIVNDRTLVPVRVISEALGAVVNWNEETETVTIDLK